MECLEIDRMYSGPCPGNGVGPSTLQPASSNASSSQVSSEDHWDQGPPSSQDQNNSHGQLALTQAALEAWGNKVIASGKKHPGKRYVTKWVLS